MQNEEYLSRLADLQRFYTLMEELDGIVGGKRLLRDCHGRMDWPKRGVYFFFEEGENRTTSGDGLRVVRVGTHALVEGGKATLWRRLRQHRGNLKDGGGNHRGSVFRKHVGYALIRRHLLTGPGTETWGVDNHAPTHVHQQELFIEQMVSDYIRTMPFLWLEIDDPPGPCNRRESIERNSIALLSIFNQLDHPIDPPSSTWLGRCAKNFAVQCSGLWNDDYVDEISDPKFLDSLEGLIREMAKEFAR